MPFLAGVVCLAYLNAFYGVFQYDDYNVIVSSAKVHSLAAWVRDLPSGIRPLLKLTYLANWVSGAGLFGFHLVNLCIHLANTCLVFLLVRDFRADNGGAATPAALIAAGIFALHPVQTEAVTYISGRSTSLAALFYLAGVWAHGGAHRGPLFRMLVPPLFFVMALLTKETSITFPVALLLWEAVRNGFRAGLRNALGTQWLSWLILLAACLALLAHPRYGALLEYSFDIRGWQENLLAQVNGIWYLLTRLFVLNGMNIDPDIAMTQVGDAAYLAKGGILTALALLGLCSRRRYPWLAFGLLWFFLQLLPTNSLVPRLDLVNDRQLYLPLAGIALAAGYALAPLLACRTRQQRLTALALLFCLLGICTALRNRDYASEIALWQDAAAKSPRKARVFNNLGYAYCLAGRRDEGCRSYAKALALDPGFTFAVNNWKTYCDGPVR